MKIICTQENLKNGLGAVVKIISSSLTLPVLNTVLLNTDAGQLKISATNLEIGIDTYTRCKIEQEGSVCVPAKPLTDLVNSLSGKNITLEVKGNDLLIQSDGFQAKLKTMPSEDFPVIPQADGDIEVKLPADVLKTALGQVVFAVSMSETQPEISGVLMSFINNKIKLTATDRYRLAEKEINSENIQESKKIIIPHKTIQEIIRILGVSSDSQVIIRLSDSQISVKINETNIISRLINGQYPPYEEIIPKNYESLIKVNKSTLFKAIKTASVLSENNHIIRFKYSDKLTITATSETFGEGESEAEAEITGPAGEIIFNHRYIQDMLNVIDNERIEIKILNNSTPVVINIENDPGYLYLVMPINN